MNKKLCCVIVSMVFLLALGFGASDAAAADGKKIYMKYCASCHGKDGRGDGALAKTMSPHPRDFTLGSYKIRSNFDNALPLDADLARVIKNGVPGTSMLSWGALLDDSEINALLPVIKGFSEFAKAQRPAPPIAAKINISYTTESVEKGKKLYMEKKCFECHGDTGRGDGPKSDVLKDSMGHPIVAYDFTRGDRMMKGGNTDKDIYLRFTIGMAGTPMPSYADSLTDDERWQLVHYVRSLMKPSQCN